MNYIAMQLVLSKRGLFFWEALQPYKNEAMDGRKFGVWNA